MTATNHALTGAIIGLSVANPFVAVIAAFLSHYICDAIPHFDEDIGAERMKKSSFKLYLAADALFCVVLVVVLAIFRPELWFLGIVCAFLATSPDLFWINRYRHILQKKPWKPGLHSRFASKIQWFERPIGAAVEAVWFVLGVGLLIALV